MIARKYIRGVTLIELMIVVVIVSILAAVSYPSYREFAARAKRNEAKAALLKAATNQERFYLQNNIFSDDLTELGFSSNPFETDTGSYRIEITTPPPNPNPGNFEVTATYLLSGAESNKCLTFVVDGRGDKTSGPDTNCWTRTR